MKRIHIYCEILVVVSLFAANVWADDTIAQAYDSTSTPVSIQESAQTPPVNIENETLLLDEIRQLRAELESVRAASETSAQPAGAEDELRKLRELRQLRAELDSAKALLDFHGIRPYTYRIILKNNTFAEVHAIITDDTAFFSEAVFNSTKLTLNFKTAVSPYVGIDVGAGFFILYVGANAGVEKQFIYDNGISITPSLGAHAGMFGFWEAYPAGGVHSFVEFGFSHKRLGAFLMTGIRLNFAKARDLRGGTLSIPLGTGLSLKL